MEDSWRRFLAPPCDDRAEPALAGYLTGQSVLITGAGGYIGSALARAVAGAGPESLVLLDSCEYNLFQLQQAPVSGGPALHETVLGSVLDSALLDDILARTRPGIIFHAAAYKHVPLLEYNPLAAIRNNVVGTYTLVEAILRHGPARLIVVSTDKAVEPRSIMGASKRLAELIALSLSTPQHAMNAVRLGNVIGSSGSVVPTFLSEIAAHQPITLTHPEAARYFMSLREAVEAILAAGAFPCGGRILLPELGPPIGIKELARYLISAAGNGPLPVRVTGLRPGEKVNEDLLFASEARTGRAGPLEVVESPAPAPSALAAMIGRLRAARSTPSLLAALAAAVPEYSPSGLLLGGDRA